MIFRFNLAKINESRLTEKGQEGKPCVVCVCVCMFELCVKISINTQLRI